MPAYVWPGCGETFPRWNQCLSHIRLTGQVDGADEPFTNRLQHRCSFKNDVPTGAGRGGHFAESSSGPRVAPSLQPRRQTARYLDCEVYAADVVSVSASKKREVAPVNVRCLGYSAEKDAWKSFSDMDNATSNANSAEGDAWTSFGVMASATSNAQTTARTKAKAEVATLPSSQEHLGATASHVGLTPLASSSSSSHAVQRPQFHQLELPQLQLQHLMRLRMMQLQLSQPIPRQQCATQVRTLYSSRFLYHYDRTQQKPHLQDGAGALLQSALQDLGYNEVAQAFSQKLSQRGGDLVEAAVALWTTKVGPKKASPHSLLNGALLADDDRALSLLMGLVRLMTFHVTRSSNKISKRLTTWRGSKLQPEQVASLRAGEVIRPPNFIATSLARQAAEVFGNHSKSKKILMKFHIPKGCRNACNIRRLSDFKGQKEVLMPPYTPLRILSVSSKLVEVEVLNGLHFMRDVELPGGACARTVPI